MGNIIFSPSPDPIELAGNEIVFGIVGANARTTKSTEFVGILSLTNQQLDGNSIILNWGSNSITFIASDSPLENGIDFPAVHPVGSITSVYYWFLLVYLTYNVPIISDFVLSVNTDPLGIKFVSRKKGANNQLSVITNPPNHATLTITQNAADEIINENYQIVAKVEINGEFISEHSFPPVEIPESLLNVVNPLSNTSAWAGINISQLAEKEQGGHFSFPYPASIYGKTHNLSDVVRIYAYETWGNPLVKHAGKFSLPINVFQGKLGNYRKGELNSLQKSFYDSLNSSGMFLSFAPSTKKTDIYASERLYFLCTEAKMYRLAVKQTFSNNYTTYHLRDAFYANKNEIREYFIGYEKVRTNAPLKLVSFEVYLVNTNVPIENYRITEVRKFTIDYTYQQHARYFIFKNSLGVYETIRTIGKAVKTRNINKEFIRVPLPINFSNTDREEKQTDASVETSYNINFGYFDTKEDAEYAQEFLMSNDVYWLKRGKAYPVTIKPGKNTVFKDNSYNPEADFDLTHQLHDDVTEQFTANEPIIIGDFNLDFNTDYFVGN